ncbi:hypothetical protein HUU42_10870 [bacterium]|nr:hypothetical protein [bacterium]
MKSIINDIKHEISGIDRNVKSVRKFGIFLSVFLLLIAGYFFYKSNSIWIWFGITGAASALLALVIPMMLFPIYYGLTFISMIIGYFVSKLILTTMFAFFFIPVGLITRLLRKDLLNKRIDKKASTYWYKKEVTPFSKEKYERLF